MTPRAIKPFSFGLTIAVILSVLLGMPAAAGSTDPDQISIVVSKKDISLAAGEWGSFEAKITNNTKERSKPLIAQASLARITEGVFADPEDCFSTLNTFIDPLQPGESANTVWEVHGVFDGNFIMFITLLSNDSSFSPISSPAISLTVQPSEILPLDGILPTTLMAPFILFLCLVVQLVKNRKSGPSTA